MKFVVISSFRDSNDELYTYLVGDTFPREGYEPGEDRVKELSSTDNKIGKVLIVKVPELKSDNEQDNLPVDLSGNVGEVNEQITTDLGKEALENLLKVEQEGKNRKGVIEHIESLLKEGD